MSPAGVSAAGVFTHGGAGVWGAGGGSRPPGDAATPTSPSTARPSPHRRPGNTWGDTTLTPLDLVDSIRVNLPVLCLTRGLLTARFLLGYFLAMESRYFLGISWLSCFHDYYNYNT